MDALTPAETEALECIRLICEWKGMQRSTAHARGTELNALKWAVGHTPAMPDDLSARCQAAIATLSAERGQ